MNNSSQILYDIIRGQSLNSTINKINDQQNKMKKYIKNSSNIVKKIKTDKKIQSVCDGIIQAFKKEPQIFDENYNEIMERVSNEIDPLKKILIFSQPIMKHQLPTDTYERTYEKDKMNLLGIYEKSEIYSQGVQQLAEEKNIKDVFTNKIYYPETELKKVYEQSELLTEQTFEENIKKIKEDNLLSINEKNKKIKEIEYHKKINENWKKEKEKIINDNILDEEEKKKEIKKIDNHFKNQFRKETKLKYRDEEKTKFFKSLKKELKNTFEKYEFSLDEIEDIIDGVKLIDNEHENLMEKLNKIKIKNKKRKNLIIDYENDNFKILQDYHILKNKVILLSKNFESLKIPFEKLKLPFNKNMFENQMSNDDIEDIKKSLKMYDEAYNQLENENKNLKNYNNYLNDQYSILIKKINEIEEKDLSISETKDILLKYEIEKNSYMEEIEKITFENKKLKDLYNNLIDENSKKINHEELLKIENEKLLEEIKKMKIESHEKKVMEFNTLNKKNKELLLEIEQLKINYDKIKENEQKLINEINEIKK